LLRESSTLSARSEALIGGDETGSPVVSEVFSVVGMAWTSLSASTALNSSLFYSFSTTVTDDSDTLASSSAFSAFGSGNPGRFHLP
jgi:hypothetical protein